MWLVLAKEELVNLLIAVKVDEWNSKLQETVAFCMIVVDSQEINGLSKPKIPRKKPNKKRARRQALGWWGLGQLGCLYPVLEYSALALGSSFPLMQLSGVAVMVPMSKCLTHGRSCVCPLPDFGSVQPRLSQVTEECCSRWEPLAFPSTGQWKKLSAFPSVPRSLDLSKRKTSKDSDFYVTASKLPFKMTFPNFFDGW